jgi:hypothetical protein
MDRNLRGDSLTVAMNKRIHALIGEEKLKDLGLDACWAWERRTAGSVCRHCGRGYYEHSNPKTDYFSPSLPDDLRVAMVTAAVEKFGEMTLCAEVLRIALGPTQEVYETLNASLLALPAPAIAEAIDRLILEERK